MAIVKQAEKQVKYRQQMYTDNKFMYMNNIDITMLIFCVRLSDIYIFSIFSIFYYTKVVFSPPRILTFLCPLR